MSNRIAYTPTLVLLAVAIAAFFGCDTSRVPAPPPQATSAVPRGELLAIGSHRRDDPSRNRVWILNDRGLFLYYTGTPEKLVEISLPSWQWVDAPYGCPPGLALGPKGEAVVTSNIVPTLWRIDPDSLAVTTHELVLDADKDKDVGFSSLEYSSEHGAFLAVSDVHGSLWRIDPLLTKGQKLSHSVPVGKAASCPRPHTRSPHDGNWHGKEA
jgi:hypothetical protein